MPTIFKRRDGHLIKEKYEFRDVLGTGAFSKVRISTILYVENGHRLAGSTIASTNSQSSSWRGSSDFGW